MKIKMIKMQRLNKEILQERSNKIHSYCFNSVGENSISDKLNEIFNI